MGNSAPEILEKMRRAPASIRFTELTKVCDHYFESRQTTKTSHRTYKTPWRGDPRVNIQNSNGKAKPYQVRQALRAVDKLETRRKKGGR